MNSIPISGWTSKHHFMIAVGVGVLAGFYFANAPTGTGIYGTFIGQTAANLYVAGAKAGGGTAPALAATPATPVAS